MRSTDAVVAAAGEAADQTDQRGGLRILSFWYAFLRPYEPRCSSASSVGKTALLGKADRNDMYGVDTTEGVNYLKNEYVRSIPDCAW